MIDILGIWYVLFKFVNCYFFYLVELNLEEIGMKYI